MSDTPDRRASPPDKAEDRRRANVGPPSGTPGRRGRLARYDHRISLGSIIQTVTIAFSVLGAAVTAIFASGAYVQSLRDDVIAAEGRTSRNEVAADARVLEMLQRLVDKK